VNICDDVCCDSELVTFCSYMNESHVRFGRGSTLSMTRRSPRARDDVQASPNFTFAYIGLDAIGLVIRKAAHFIVLGTDLQLTTILLWSIMFYGVQ
jgi:hypothetical protein